MRPSTPNDEGGEAIAGDGAPSHEPIEEGMRGPIGGAGAREAEGQGCYLLLQRRTAENHQLTTISPGFGRCVLQPVGRLQ